MLAGAEIWASDAQRVRAMYQSLLSFYLRRQLQHARPCPVPPPLDPPRCLPPRPNPPQTTTNKQLTSTNTLTMSARARSRSKPCPIPLSLSQNTHIERKPFHQVNVHVPQYLAGHPHFHADFWDSEARLPGLWWQGRIKNESRTGTCDRVKAL